MSKFRIGCQVRIVREGPIWHAFANLCFPNGKCLVIKAKADQRQIIALLQKAAEPVMDQALSQVSGYPTLEVGIFGGFKKWLKKSARKLAQAKLIKGVLSGVKKVLRNPVIGKLVGLASFVPFVGPALKAGWDVAKKVDEGLSKIASAAKAGNMAAKAIVNQVSANAKGGNPNAINVAAKFSQALAA